MPPTTTTTSPLHPLTPPVYSPHANGTNLSQSSPPPASPSPLPTPRPPKTVPVKYPVVLSQEPTQSSTSSAQNGSQSSRPSGPPTPPESLPGRSIATSSDFRHDGNAFGAEQQQHDDGSWTNVQPKKRMQQAGNPPKAVPTTHDNNHSHKTYAQKDTAIAQKHNAPAKKQNQAAGQTAHTSVPWTTASQKALSYFDAATKYFRPKPVATSNIINNAAPDRAPLVGQKVSFQALLNRLRTAANRLMQALKLCCGKAPFTGYRSIRGEPLLCHCQCPALCHCPALDNILPLLVPCPCHCPALNSALSLSVPCPCH